MVGSLRGRMIVILYAVTLFVAGAVCWVGAVIVEQEVENRLVHDAAGNVSRVMNGMNLRPTDAVLNRLAEIVDGEILVVNASGNIEGSSLGTAKPKLPDTVVNLAPGTSADMNVDSVSYVVGASDLPAQQPGNTYKLLILIPEERIANARHTTTNRLITWTLVVVVVATVMILLVSSGVTGALVRLTDDLDSMSRRVTSEGVEGLKGATLKTQGPDETKRLVEAFQRLITSLQDAENKLAKLEQLAAIGKVTASVVHEIRNPLSGIQMHLRLLSDEDLNNPDVEESLDIISREVKRLDLYVDELVVLAKSGSPVSTDVELVSVDIKGELDYTLKLLEGKVSHAAVELSCRVPDELPPVAADPIRIRQVLMNILINALEATPPNGAIEVEITVEGSKVILSVRDSGDGISADVSTIFDAFVTTKPHGGGLGLYICRQIMTSFGGEIRGYNHDDGACFELKLNKFKD